MAVSPGHRPPRTGAGAATGGLSGALSGLSAIVTRCIRYNSFHEVIPSWPVGRDSAGAGLSAVAPTDEALQRLTALIRGQIPMAVAMGLSLSRSPAGDLLMHAPLEPNRNDKGSAFGGSLGALCTLACWGLVWLHMRAHPGPCDIVIASSRMDYLQPVHDDIEVIAHAPDAADWQIFDRRYRRRGKARIGLAAQVAGSPVAARFEGDFAALAQSAVQPTARIFSSSHV